MKKQIIAATALALVGVGALAGCSRDADVVSENLSYAADAFEVDRRIIFYNGITDSYMFTIEGRCSIEVDGADYQLEVTCKLGPDEYAKHFLGFSDNVTYFVEQIGTSDVDEYHYSVLFKPETLIPSIDPQFGVTDTED